MCPPCVSMRPGEADFARRCSAPSRPFNYAPPPVRRGVLVRRGILQARALNCPSGHLVPGPGGNAMRFLASFRRLARALRSWPRRRSPPRIPTSPSNTSFRSRRAASRTSPRGCRRRSFKAKYKQEMIVVNKPGAGGALAWSQMNNMPGDGHTIIGVNLPHIVLQPLEPATPIQDRGHHAGLLLPLHAGRGDRRRRQPVQDVRRPRQGGA